MEKVLILIGAGYVVNKCSASLVVGNVNCECDICEVSKKRVHIRLQEYSKTAYSAVYLIGISLNYHTIEIAKYAKRMQKNGAKIVWISAFDAIDNKEELKEFVELYYPEEHTCLLEMTRRYLKINKGNELFKNLNNIVYLTSDKNKQLRDLINAGSSRYRRFQDMTKLSSIIKDIANYKSAAWRDRYLEQQRIFLEEYYRFGSREFTGKSQKTLDLKEKIKLVGENNECNVLINGETGTGKETIANLIHGYSNRKGSFFIPFNCAELSPQLIESKLFGHIKGAFTGADKDKAGAFELADGGTLFLDELAELSLEVQAGLLRVIQEKRFCKLGAEKEIEVDVRIIGATNKNIFELIKEGKFREDLYYRLSAIEIDSIPLRENREDIAQVANSYSFNKKYPKLTEEQISVLTNEYDWPGNVRELQNIIDRANILKNNNYHELLNEYKYKKHKTKVELELLSDIAHEHAVAMLAKYKGNQTHAAKAMGIALNTLKTHIKSAVTS